MKIRFERKDLLPKLRLAKNITSHLGNIKILADKRHGTVIHATDGKHGIRIRFDCEVARKGAVLLPIKEIVNILSQSKQDMLWLEVKNDKIVMRGEECGQWEFSLQMS